MDIDRPELLLYDPSMSIVGDLDVVSEIRHGDIFYKLIDVCRFPSQKCEVWKEALHTFKPYLTFYRLMRLNTSLVDYMTGNPFSQSLAVDNAVGIYIDKKIEHASPDVYGYLQELRWHINKTMLGSTVFCSNSIEDMQQFLFKIGDMAYEEDEQIQHRLIVPMPILFTDMETRTVYTFYQKEKVIPGIGEINDIKIVYTTSHEHLPSVTHPPKQLIVSIGDVITLLRDQDPCFMLVNYDVSLEQIEVNEPSTYKEELDRYPLTVSIAPNDSHTLPWYDTHNLFPKEDD